MEQLLRIYDSVQYVDAFGRRVADMAELAELIPEHSEAPTCRWLDRDTGRHDMKFIGLGAHVWAIGQWDNLRAVAPPALNLPTVFSLDGLLYVVQTDLVPKLTEEALTIMVSPLATKVGEQVLANHDPFHIDTRMGTGYHFLARLRDKALRKNPGLSFRLAAKQGLALTDVRILDHTRIGRHRGTTLLDTGSGTQRWLSFTMYEGMAVLGKAPEGVDSVKAARAKVIGL